MDLEEKRNLLKSDIIKYTTIVDNNKSELDGLTDKTQPPTSGIINFPHQFAHITEKEGEYEYILGGDGKSKPWSEVRTGEIVMIKVKNSIYLSNNQQTVLHEIVSSFYPHLTKQQIQFEL